MNYCPNCASPILESLQVRKGKYRKYPDGFLTCVNAACRRVVNINNGDVFKNGRLENKK